MEGNKLILIDENNIEKEMEILFTFEKDEDNKYVIYYDPIEEEIEYFAARYTEDGNLFPDISDDEWDMCLEMLNTYLEDIDE